MRPLLFAIAVLVCAGAAGCQAPSPAPRLVYSVTVPEGVPYRVPAPGAPHRKDGRVVLDEARLYLEAHRWGWAEYVIAYAKGSPSTALSIAQETGLEGQARQKGWSDARRQIAELERHFTPDQIRAYLVHQGYTIPHPREMGFDAPL